MFDYIECHECGFVWEASDLANYADEAGMTEREAKQAFRADGCKAFREWETTHVYGDERDGECDADGWDY